MMYQPLRITAYVAGSISLARPEDLSLDGLLAYQVLRRHFGEEFYHLPDPKEQLLFARLPLDMRGRPSPAMQQMQTGATWDDTSLWYWACSSAQIEIKGRGTQHWNKRFDVQPALSDHIDFGGKREKILIEEGRFKAYHMPLSTIIAEKVVWYAYGEKEEITVLLQGMNLGKKRSQGNGYVKRWQIVEVSEDYSEWKDGQLMRPLPGPLAQHITPLDIQYIAFRAPQWHTRNQAMCVTKAVQGG